MKLALPLEGTRKCFEIAVHTNSAAELGLKNLALF